MHHVIDDFVLDDPAQTVYMIMDEFILSNRCPARTRKRSFVGVVGDRVLHGLALALGLHQGAMRRGRGSTVSTWA